MAWNFVQGKNTDQAAGTSLGVTLTSNVTVGNRLIAVVYVYGSGITLSQVSDNLGNQGSVSGKYDQAITQNDPFNGKLYIMTAPITTGGACTITATATGSASFISLWVGEYSGLSTTAGSGAWDVTSGNNGTIGTSNSTGSTAPTQGSGELAVACLGDTEVGASAAFSMTSPGGWNVRSDTTVGNSTSNLPLVVIDQTPASGANVSATWTCGNTDGSNGFAAAVVTFITPPPPNTPTTVVAAKAGPAWKRQFKHSQFVTPLVANQPPPGQAPGQVIRRITPQPRARSKKPIVTAGTIGVTFNSSGIAPIVTIAIQKPKPKFKQPIVTAKTTGVQFNSGGLAPILTIAVQKPRVRTYHPQIVVPPTPVVIIQGTTPIVTLVKQKTKSRAKPPYVSATTTGIFFNSSGVPPTVTFAKYPKSKFIKRQPLVIIAPIYNSGGLLPMVTMVSQKKPKPTRPKAYVSPAPVYNSGGLIPIFTKISQKPRPLHKSPFILTPTYNSGGVAPIFTDVIQKKRPTRPGAKIIIPGASAIVVQGTKPIVTLAVQKTQPRAKRFSHLVLQPVIIPPGTQPIVTFVRQRPRPLSYRAIPKPGFLPIHKTILQTLSVNTTSRVVVQPGLFRIGEAFPDAIIIQFRPFRITLMNKIDVQ